MTTRMPSGVPGAISTMMSGGSESTSTAIPCSPLMSSGPTSIFTRRADAYRRSELPWAAPTRAHGDAFGSAALGEELPHGRREVGVVLVVVGGLEAGAGASQRVLLTRKELALALHVGTTPHPRLSRRPARRRARPRRKCSRSSASGLIPLARLRCFSMRNDSGSGTASPSVGLSSSLRRSTAQRWRG